MSLRFGARTRPATMVSTWLNSLLSGIAPSDAPGTLSLANGTDATSQVDLSWSAPTDAGGGTVSGYHIQVSTNGSSWSDQAADTGTTATTYTASSLSSSTQYWFRVAAINEAGTGAYGNEPDHTTGSQTTASGGTITDYTEDGTNYRSHRFTSTGTLVVSNAGAGLVDVLLVAGGASGSGWKHRCGGGGAGGFRALEDQSITATSYTITVGAGGTAPGSPTVLGVSGSASSAALESTIASTGGGGGGASGQTAANGGSGGGGSDDEGAGTGNAGGYSPVEGYAGVMGANHSNYPSSILHGGGGGGGATATGTTGSFVEAGGTAGAGGAGGANTYFDGTSDTYAGGGGGQGWRQMGSGTANGGAGGSGGGGTGGGTSSGAGSAATDGLGGGGGAGVYNGIGYDGGNGVVVIRYPYG